MERGCFAVKIQNTCIHLYFTFLFLHSWSKRYPKLRISFAVSNKLFQLDQVDVNFIISCVFGPIWSQSKKWFHCHEILQTYQVQGAKNVSGVYFMSISLLLAFLGQIGPKIKIAWITMKLCKNKNCFDCHETLYTYQAEGDKNVSGVYFTSILLFLAFLTNLVQK